MKEPIPKNIKDDAAKIKESCEKCGCKLVAIELSPLPNDPSRHLFTIQCLGCGSKIEIHEETFEKLEACIEKLKTDAFTKVTAEMRHEDIDEMDKQLQETTKENNATGEEGSDRKHIGQSTAKRQSE